MRRNWPAGKLLPFVLTFGLLRGVAGDPALLVDKTFGLPAELNGRAQTLTPDGRGNFIALGSFEYTGWEGSSLIALFGPDGTLVTNFNASELRSFQLTGGAVAVGWGDAIYVAGVIVTEEAGTVVREIVKLDYSGKRQDGFRADFRYDAQVRGMIGSPEGLIVFGSFSEVNGKPATNIVRFRSNGSIDAEFGPNLKGVPTVGVRQADGKIVLAGNFELFPGRARLLRLNGDGTFDSNFKRAGESFDNDVGTMALDKDGNIIVAGAFRNFGNVRGHIARFLRDGTLDEEFFPGTGTDETITAVLPEENGDIVIAGAFNRFQTNIVHRVARLHSDGSLDTSFNTGKGPNSGVLSMVALGGGRQALLSGYFGSIDDFEEESPARINLRPPEKPFVGFTQAQFVVNEWDGEATVILKRYGDQSGVSVVRLGTTAGTALADVDYLSVSTEVRFEAGETEKQIRISILQDGLVEPTEFFDVRTVAEENCSGDDTANVAISDDEIPVMIDEGFGLGALAHNPQLPVAIQSSGKIIVAAFDNADLQTRQSLYRLEKNGEVDPSFRAAFDSAYHPNILVVQPDDKILVSAFNNDFSSGRLWRLLPDGNADPAFKANNSPGVSSLLLMDDGRMYTSTPLHRLNADGTVDATFQPPDTNAIPAAVQPDGKLILAKDYFQDPRKSLVRLKLDGSVDTTFHPDPPEPAAKVTVQKDGKLLVTCGQYYGWYGRKLVRLNSDGTRDRTFNADSSSADWPYTVFQAVTDETGAIWVAGSYSLLKLKSDGTRDPAFVMGREFIGQLASIVPDGRGDLLISGDYIRSLRRIYGSNSRVSQIIFGPEKGAVSEEKGKYQFSVMRKGYAQDALDLPLVLNPKLEEPPVTLANERLVFPALRTNAAVTLIIEDNEIANWNQKGQITANLSQAEHPITQKGGEITIVDNDGRPWNLYGDLNGPEEDIISGLYGAVETSTGNLVVWGYGPQPYPVIKVFTSEGPEITNFFKNLSSSEQIVFSQVMKSGKILIWVKGDENTTVKMLNSDGSADANFSFPFSANTSAFVQEQSDGKLIVAGWIPIPELNYGNGIVRLFANGEVDKSFKRIVLYESVSTLFIQPDDAIVVAGNLGLSRFLKDGATDISTPLAMASATPDNRGGFFITRLIQDSQGLTRSSFARMLTDGTFDQRFSQIGDLLRIINCVVAETNGTVWVGGLAKESTGASLFHILANGTVDKTFSETASFTRSGGICSIYSILPQNNGDVIVAGDFNEFSGIRVNGLVRLKGARPELRMVQSGGGMELRVPTIPGRTFVVERSSDLKEWSGVLTNTSSSFEWKVPVGSETAAQFLRVFHR